MSVHCKHCKLISSPHHSIASYKYAYCDGQFVLYWFQWILQTSTYNGIITIIDHTTHSGKFPNSPFGWKHGSQPNLLSPLASTMVPLTLPGNRRISELGFPEKKIMNKLSKRVTATPNLSIREKTSLNFSIFCAAMFCGMKCTISCLSLCSVVIVRGAYKENKKARSHWRQALSNWKNLVQWSWHFSSLIDSIRIRKSC